MTDGRVDLSLPLSIFSMWAFTHLPNEYYDQSHAHLLKKKKRLPRSPYQQVVVKLILFCFLGFVR